MVSVESRASRGKSWRKVPVALWVMEDICLVKRSLDNMISLHFMVYNKTFFEP